MTENDDEARRTHVRVQRGAMLLALVALIAYRGVVPIRARLDHRSEGYRSGAGLGHPGR